ncbi:uncharacterized protein LOC141901975 [Tubulanus polymorphus]|uniref:uncharacterized protein LOC141901975 n=1 Tax=Tubulanus polymorphus TaxID=672921 RepID=UPI003DA58C23
MTGNIILLFFCSTIAGSLATAYPDKVHLENFSIDLAEFINAVHNVEALSRKDIQNTGCSCPTDTKCGCCADIVSKLLRINSTGCVNMTYDKVTTDINVVMTLDGKVYVNETINLHNPPALCQGLPYVATWCTVFYNTSWVGKVGACLRFELRLLGQTVLKIPVGCFQFPTRSVRAKHTQHSRHRMALDSRNFFEQRWKAYENMIQNRQQEVKRRKNYISL